MDNLNNIPNVGNWGDAASKLNDNFNKIKQSLTTVENTSKNNKGYFTSLSALNTAFPSPKDGQTAYVYDEESSTNYYIYNAVNGAWVASSVEAPSVGVDIAGYTKTGGSTKTTKEVEDEIVQLAGEGINNMMLGLNYSLSGTPVYENDTIKSSDIIWANNDVGRLTFSDYDENEACFTSFQATNTNRSLKVLQPSVTYNPNGEIQNYPALTIEKY